MILSAHQPAYLPWLGYFDKIARADIFVYLDDVQFEKNSFINRNKIKTPQGSMWLTMPVKLKGHTTNTMLETPIDDGQPWRAKHLKSIVSNYRKAPFFDALYPEIESIVLHPSDNIAEICWFQLNVWLKQLNIKTKVVRASTLALKSRKSQLIFDLCKQFGAEYYLSGVLGRDYLDEASFSAAGINIEYQTYRHPIYPQLWGEFMPFMSVVDYLMNVGPGPLREEGISTANRSQDPRIKFTDRGKDEL